MKRILTTLVLAAICTNAMAQYNSRIQMFAGNFSSPEFKHHGYYGKKPVINYIGASFEHRLYKGLGIKVQHSRWVNLQSNSRGQGYSTYRVVPAYSWAGTVTGRSDYQCIEVAQTYALRMGRHDVYVAAGPSVTWGITDMIGYNPRDANNTWGDVQEIQTVQTKLGMVAELGYNVRVLGPISVGVAGIYKYYEFFNNYAAQFNIGYNFNSINLHK